MPDKPVKLPIPADVLERFQRDSDPGATDDDVRDAIIDTIHDLADCPACAGLGKVSPQRARRLRDAIEKDEKAYDTNG